MVKFMADHLYDNITINMNLFKAAHMSNIKKVVSLSSINAFPASEENYYEESKLWDGEPHEACYTDGYKNRLLHILSKSYKKQYDISCAVPMLTNTYGPKSSIRNGVIPYLIDKCYRAMIAEEDLVVDGDGTPVRDFIYVKDVAKLVDWTIHNYDSIEPVIFSSGEQTTIKELVDMITKYMNFNGKVIWVKDKVAGQPVKLCDNSKLKSHLPNFNFTSIEDGLKDTVNWFLKSKDTNG
jgi:GDP-L-fucose synthase